MNTNENESTLKNVLRMAWPAVVESFFRAFAGLIDSYMVSSLGPNSVAAVGLTTQPKFMGLAAFFAINVAVSALVARRRGEKNKKAANSIMLTSLILIVILAVVLSIVLVGAANGIINFCGSNADTHKDAVTYFRIIMGGMIFDCIQMGVNSAQRGAGNTKITMRTNVTSGVINIIFNYLLIGGHLGFPALGIVGAALATVLGTVVACFMSIASLFEKDCFVSIPYIIKEKIRPGIDSLISIVKVGYSVFFEQVLMRVGFMATAIMAADMGTYEMAAHQVGMNIMGLSFAFGDGLQVTAVALIGKSLGEKNKDLAKEYGKTCRAVGGVIAAALAVIYFFGARLMMSAFFSDEYIVNIGVNIMRVIVFVVVLQISQVIYMGCLRGAGDTAYTAVASIISVTIIRTLFSYLGGYVLGFGIIGVWLGVVADQFSRFVFGSVRFSKGKWTEIKI